MTDTLERSVSCTLPVGHRIPRDATLVSIVEAYKGLDEAIHCGLESCHAAHKKGFVVAYL